MTDLVLPPWQFYIQSQSVHVYKSNQAIWTFLLDIGQICGFGLFLKLRFSPNHSLSNVDHMLQTIRH